MFHPQLPWVNGVPTHKKNSNSRQRHERALSTDDDHQQKAYFPDMNIEPASSCFILLSLRRLTRHTTSDAVPFHPCAVSAIHFFLQ